MENRVNVNFQIQNTSLIDLNLITNKIKTKLEAVYFCQSISKINFNISDLYFPREKMFDVDFFFLVASGKKKVRIF